MNIEPLKQLIEDQRKKRLDWDIYFLRIAKEVSSQSKCLSRKIGSILVKDNCIISTGRNGPPRGVKHCNERTPKFYYDLDNRMDYLSDNPVIENMFRTICPRKVLEYKSGEGLHICNAVHSEVNTIIQAARNGISTKDTSLYCYCEQICKNCAGVIINSGVKELIYLKSDKPYDNYSEIILRESGITIREIERNLVDEKA